MHCTGTLPGSFFFIIYGRCLGNMSSTTSFYEPHSLVSDKPSTDLETADSQICEKETITDDADDLEYNHEHEDEEYHATSRGLTVVFKVPRRPFAKLEPWTNRTSNSTNFAFLHLQDLEYIIRNQADRKSDISLLRGVTGVLHSGLMSALVSPCVSPGFQMVLQRRISVADPLIGAILQMGPSGSGKTTLLGEQHCE